MFVLGNGFSDLLLKVTIWNLKSFNSGIGYFIGKIKYVSARVRLFYKIGAVNHDIKSKRKVYGQPWS